MLPYSYLRQSEQLGPQTRTSASNSCLGINAKVVAPRVVVIDVENIWDGSSSTPEREEGKHEIPQSHAVPPIPRLASREVGPSHYNENSVSNHRRCRQPTIAHHPSAEWNWIIFHLESEESIEKEHLKEHRMVSY